MRGAPLDIKETAATLVGCFPTLGREEQRLSLALAEGRPVSIQRLARDLGRDAEVVTRTLRGWQGVFYNGERDVIGYWGLSPTHETTHCLKLDGRTLYAWCAWDTLFLPALLGKTAEVESISPGTKTPVRLTVDPDGVRSAEPRTGVMSFVMPDRQKVQEDVVASFCHFLHFFPSPQEGDAWVAEHPGASLLSLKEAFELGRHKNRLQYPDFVTVCGWDLTQKAAQRRKRQPTASWRYPLARQRAAMSLPSIGNSRKSRRCGDGSVGPLAALIPRPALRLLASSSAGRVPRKQARDVAALFVDVERCTRLCEDLPPREMNEVIERYFSSYLDVVRGLGGEVTEILGDGLLALFERDRLECNARAALQAALEIQGRTRRLNQRPRMRHDPVAVNIGLNAGSALVGFTRLRGRAEERWVYAASGPVTNVAARLSSLARGGQILTTKATAALFPAGCDCRSLGPQILKNVTGPVDVVEVLEPAAGNWQAGVISCGDRSARRSGRGWIEPGNTRAVPGVCRTGS